jgi:acetyl-CoA C-acetyltransferase
VVVGVGQVRRRPGLDGDWDPQEPAVLMAQAINSALIDATAPSGSPDELRKAVDTLACIDPIGWGYDDLVGTTSQFANIKATRAMTWPPGGNSPGELLHEIANLVAVGEVQIAVLTGSEVVYSVRRARKEHVDLQQRWTPFAGKRDFLKGQRPLTTELESRHGMFAPIHCYPMYENALRAAAHRSVEEHQQFVSALMSRNSQVAATNPNAWFPTAWSASDIATVNPNNRWVCFPYPKRMNAIMEVDQAAAIIVMSQIEADRRGIPRSKQVRFLGGGSCQDPWTPAERPNLAHSEAIEAAAQIAFDHAGLSLDDIDLIDLYSCFPSAIQLAMNAIGIASDDPRGVTLTGGLAYAGGPGNSYALHAMCVATERIRSASTAAASTNTPDTKSPATALVTSLGMTASKHAVSIFGSNEVAPQADHRAHKTQLTPSQLHGPPLVDGVSGEGRIASYTAEFDRTGEVTRTIYIVDLDDGTRTVGNGPLTKVEIDRLLTIELVGQRVSVTAGISGPTQSFTGSSAASSTDATNEPNVVTFQ